MVDRRRGWKVSLLGLFVASCASAGALTSLDDLTAQVDPSGLFDSMAQQRVLSLSAMVPSGEPGRVFRFHNTRSPFTAFGISKRYHGNGASACRVHGEVPKCKSCSEKGTPGDKDCKCTTESYYLRRSIPYIPDSATEEQLTNLAAARIALEEADWQCNHAEDEAEAQKRVEYEKKKQEHREALKLAASTAGTPPELLTLRNDLNKLRLKASEIVRKRIEAVAARNAATTTDERDAAIAVETDAETTMGEFNDLLQKCTAAVDRPGLLIVRYSVARELDLAARLGALIGLDTERKEESSGFSILADIEVATIYVGSDFVEWAKPPGSDWSLIGTRFPYIASSELPFIGQWSVDHCYVVTSRLAAKHVIYGSDRLTESRIEANVKASVEQLQNLGDTLSEIDEIEIEGVLTAVESLGNTGVLGEMMQEVVPECRWDGLRSFAPQDIYLVMTEYEDLWRFSESKIRLHFARLW